jgi:hypothetical protein
MNDAGLWRPARRRKSDRHEMTDLVSDLLVPFATATLKAMW